MDKTQQELEDLQRRVEALTRENERLKQEHTEQQQQQHWDDQDFIGSPERAERFRSSSRTSRHSSRSSSRQNSILSSSLNNSFRGRPGSRTNGFAHSNGAGHIDSSALSDDGGDANGNDDEGSEVNLDDSSVLDSIDVIDVDDEDNIGKSEDTWLYTSPVHSRRRTSFLSPKEWLRSERARDHFFDVVERIPQTLQGTGDEACLEDSPLNKSWDGNGPRSLRASTQVLSRSFNAAALRGMYNTTATSPGQRQPVDAPGPAVSVSPVRRTPAAYGGTRSTLPLSRSPSAATRSASGGRLGVTGGGGRYSGASVPLSSSHRSSSAAEALPARPDRYTEEPQEGYVHVPNPNRVLRKHEREQLERTPIAERLKVSTGRGRRPHSAGSGHSAAPRRGRRISSQFTSQL